MKDALTALLVGMLLLVFLCLGLDIYKGKSTIDIHVHDTYFVLAISTWFF